MRITREISGFLGKLLAPKTPGTTGTPIQPGKLILSKQDSAAGKASASTAAPHTPVDRVTLSKPASVPAPLLTAGSAVRPDLPPVANPAADPYLGAEEFPTYRAVDAEGVVKALVPVTSGGLSLTRQQTPAAMADRETPETRRLVRAIYGQPQAADISREAFSGKGIRIRV